MPFVLGHHSSWMKDIPWDRNACIYYYIFLPSFGALLSWSGVESVSSRVSIYKVPHTLVSGGRQVILL